MPNNDSSGSADGARGSGRRHGFYAATAALVIVFAASGAPIPLHERYRVTDHLTTVDLSVAAVSYFAAVLLTLLICGRLSDHIGRRPVGVAAVTLAAAGCLVLLDVTSLGVLLTGRALHGVACGLASSALATYIVDLAPEHPRSLATTVPASAPLVGLTLGAVGSGALAEHGPAPERSAYVVLVVMLVVCAALLLTSPESVARRPGALESLRPRVVVPPAVRRRLPAATAVFTATWALGGFYQAFSPTLSAQYLGTRDTLVAGTVFSTYMLPYVVGSMVAQTFPARVAERWGMTAFAACVIGVVAGLHAGTLLVVVVFGALAGVCQGAAFTGSLGGLLAHTSSTERAGLMSAVYLISYTGAAAPSLVAGRLSVSYGLDQVALVYAALALVAVIVVLGTAPRRGVEPIPP